MKQKKLVIKFDRWFEKLHGQHKGLLIYVEDNFELSKETNQDFLNYDLRSIQLPPYEIPYGKYQLLVFLGDKNIPFTTIRKPKTCLYTTDIGKQVEVDFYFANRFKWFDIKVKRIPYKSRNDE
ncbi:MAG: hypothetical protein LBQ37_02560 [Elusimicrobiota bacterium]|jgi:hypothetical protein|nr:hypothetical protein [Elusimicrobiota bacterium]